MRIAEALTTLAAEVRIGFEAIKEALEEQVQLNQDLITLAQEQARQIKALEQWVWNRKDSESDTYL